MAVFEKCEYQERLKNVKAKMAEKNLDILLTTNPANMNYVSGYDGPSFYVPEGVAVFIEEEEPIWADDFGYEVSESVIVKENGCEPLSNVARQLFVK